MTSPPPRILLCGDVLGRLHHLFKRVQAVNKSAAGPFDALLCVGQFFPDSSPASSDELSDYIAGRSDIPIPTYFTGDYGADAPRFLSAAAALPANRGGFKTDGLEVCRNLFWLKGSGKFSLHGLSVAYLSGRGSPDGAGRYSEDDVDALRALAEDPGVVDLFLTNEWPSGVTNGADTSEAPPEVSGTLGSDPVVAELVAEIKPRYHIAGSKGVFYAREPYSNSEVVHVTRFLGLAAVGNKNKQKFIHAISPTRASTMSAADIRAKPSNTTLSPYMVAGKTNQASEATKRSANSDSDSQYWRYDVSQKRQRRGGADGERLCFKYTSTGSCPHGENCNFRHDMNAREQFLRNVCFDFLNKGKCDRGPDCKFNHKIIEEGDMSSQGRHGSQNASSYRRSSEKNCWFCLSSPNVESHLILSVGESYYCALAKGPLVRDHVLLIPIEHHPNTLTMSSEAEAEVTVYENALSRYFKNQRKTVVFFEWVFRHNSHANLQAIPVPFDRTSDIKRIFNLAAKKLGFEFATVTPTSNCNQSRKLLKSQFDEKSSLFYVELPDGTIMLHFVDDKDNFPVQFGREVLAGLLNIADRADWRNCKLSKEEELEMVDTFKKGFEQYDPAK